MTDAAVDPHTEILRRMRAADWRGSLRAIESCLAADAVNPKLLILRAQCLLALGRSADACACAHAAQRSAGEDSGYLAVIGGIFTRANDHSNALTAYDRAVRLAPDNPRYLFNRATTLRFLGEPNRAESDYDRVIALTPGDFEAYKNRSDLRTQTAQSNHIAELERCSQTAQEDWRAQVQLQFALAKEYEDLGEYANSFSHLINGSTARRRNLQYDVSVDIATVDWIIDAFAAIGEHDAADSCPDAPVFIVGLPRSGTTLVDRVLGSHPELFSAGELPCLALAIVAGVRRQGASPACSRRELVHRSAHLNFAALGRDYLDAVQATRNNTGRFTDKMPLNYLYCALIRRALPNSKIVHVTRHPMAACYAIYKTLFDSGYPFSYDLVELGNYYIAYRRLMDHWASVMPAQIHQISYEALIADQRGETRRLLEFCQLDWHPDCLRFHLNPAPTTTASAVQVRRPLYRSSVSQWRHYTTQLRGLRAQLCAAGIDVDD